MRRSLTVLALLTVLATAGCGRSHAPAEPPPTDQVTVGDSADPTGPEAVTGPDPSAVDGTIGLPDPPVDPQQRALEDSWRWPEPRGSMAQVSLRFLRALQRGDDLAALHELDRHERFTLSMHDLWNLHRVMSDVRKNAGLNDAGPCRRARQLSLEAAVVTCGTRHVVLNAKPVVGLTGVRLSDWTLHHDVFHGPHTHAYTLIDL